MQQQRPPINRLTLDPEPAAVLHDTRLHLHGLGVLIRSDIARAGDRTGYLDAVAGALESATDALQYAEALADMAVQELPIEKKRTL